MLNVFKKLYDFIIKKNENKNYLKKPNKISHISFQLQETNF